MKTYEVELEYTAYVTVTVEAENEDEAEEIANKSVESSKAGGSWRTESVEEIFN
jgi:capsular polysaccharide biosynthesis protein